MRSNNKAGLGDFQGAIVDCDCAIRIFTALDPNNADFYYWRGRVKGINGDSVGANEDFNISNALRAA